MKKKLSIAVLIVFMAVVGIFAGHYFYERDVSELTTETVLNPQEDTSAKKLKEFEDALNEFLQTIASDVQIYKNNRKMLVSLVQPENIRNSSYIEENQALASDTVESLQAQMDKIMNQFAQTDKKMTALAHNFDEAGRTEIIRRWQFLRDENSKKLVSYFESDQKILEAYNELLQFYARKREAMSVDVANKKIMFTNPEDQKVADEIIRRIFQLNAEQRAKLGQ